MFPKKNILTILAIFTASVLFIACSDNDVVINKIAASKPQTIVLDVYKSPTCGCCKKWLDHLDEYGFQSTVHNRQDISLIKSDHGIEPRYRSCHTAISKEGYVFEGHIPAKFIEQFLKERHSDGVIGLSVPAMPVGSPGMEVGEKFQAYKVLLLKSDGTYETYGNVQSYKEQF